ncbi:helix-turn-helix domain-containing protein [Hespellia stercorisuis]|uniref:DNA-binding transcriptional regulator, XRE-family HTH domain n=1 Tax=Hespellia stercorisuis DSM 15480 TaxID=1121950 RepID=A0A1M6UZM7_9FIRM|nr:helix-turn-helix transcriptional regulator [Hespellia stercorisuis]SHK74594.1 DNA-binding transcriptional regulator, XRE-family HTH domain [Hespellia stercorisuis DSM 15480]
MNKKMNKKMIGISATLLLLVIIRMVLGPSLVATTTVYYLEKKADVILVGICNGSELIQTVDQEEGAFVSQEKADVTIRKIYKNERNEVADINVDNKISIYEERLIKPDSFGSQEASVVGFTTMKDTCNYLLYLQYSESKGMYEALEYGTIPIFSDEEMYLLDEKHVTPKEKQKEKIQKCVIQQVTEKYGYQDEPNNTGDNSGMILLYIVDIMLLAITVTLLIFIIRILMKYIHSKEIRNEKNEIRKSLGEALKEQRMKCKMTQEFVAEAVGVSRQAVSKWESGASDPSTSNLIALIKLYQTTMEELLK